MDAVLKEPGLIFSLLSAMIGVTVWLIRIEGRLKAHDEVDALRFNNVGLRQDKLDKEYSELKERQARVEDKLLEKLSHIEKSLAKIEGRLVLDEKK